jgi:DNA-binding MarR family transcriptional regulator
MSTPSTKPSIVAKEIPGIILSIKERVLEKLYLSPATFVGICAKELDLSNDLFTQQIDKMRQAELIEKVTDPTQLLSLGEKAKSDSTTIFIALTDKGRGNFLKIKEQAKKLAKMYP